MKKTRMIRLAMTIVVATMAYSIGLAQETYTVPTGMYQFGVNSSGTTTVAENTDSVTVGAVMKYFALPDTATAVKNTANTYAWTITSALGSQTAGTTTNTATVTFGSTATTGTIQVIETSSLGCVGSTVTDPIQSIAAPANTAITFSTLSCPTGSIPYTLAGPTVTLGISDAMKTGAQKIIVTYNLTGPTGFSSITGTVVNLAEGVLTIPLSGVNLSQPGTYTFTITALTDRISRKSSVAGTLTVASNTFTVNRAPVTGPIYHVPNM
jgi:hypothetical protein